MSSQREYCDECGFRYEVTEGRACDECEKPMCAECYHRDELCGDCRSERRRVS